MLDKSYIPVIPVRCVYASSQRCVLQTSACSSVPVHGLPMSDGRGLSQCLYRLLIPPPQLTEQLPHDPHVDQPPSFETQFTCLNK